MKFKRLGAPLALGLVIVAGALACRTTDVFIAQATLFPTRTPRPTFTPLPPPAGTPEPIITQPPRPQYTYKSANKGCVSSGQTFVHGTIYDKDSNLINGVAVVMSDAPDGVITEKTESGTAGNGLYSMIVNAYGPAPAQSRWVWVVENGKRASDIVQFDFNNFAETNPASCWNAFVDFVQQY